MFPYLACRSTSGRYSAASSSLRRLRPLAATPFSLLPRRHQSSPSTSDPLLPHTASDPKKYSHTLLLPKTTLPQRPPVALLRETYGERTMEGLYAWQRENNKSGEEFVFLDGPPYANGKLHMGHSMNKVFKDTINRYQVARGHRVLYIPGWDCHGLPIENKALEALKANFHDLEPAKIREAASQLAEECTASQREEFKSLTVMADWSPEGTYRTLDNTFEVAQLKTFSKLVSRGLIYRQHRPTYYSPSSRTALAEAELKYKDDHVSRSVFVEFEVAEAADELELALAEQGLDGEKIGLTIWTTTPWSLGSNMAIMVNPEDEYSIVQRCGDGKLVIVGTEIAGQESSDFKAAFGEFETLAVLKGRQLLTTTYLPLFRSSTLAPHEVISSSQVTSASGTGLVHCAPAHGAEDYAAVRAGGYVVDGRLICPVDNDGKFTAEMGDRLQNKEVLGKGNDEMVKILGEKGVLLGEKRITHKYPYDWKTNQPVMTRATSQWFCDLSDVKDKALKALDSVTFVPPVSENRLRSFVKSRSEWCISRQRVWGVPIPALHDVATDTAVLTPESLEHILPILAVKGTSYWFSGPIEEFLPPSLRNDGKTYRKSTDTMDVWFDSGSAWSVLPERPEGSDRPRADVVLEGSDQHRGWFQSLLLTAIASSDAETPQAPYGTVITHGFILDGEKQKMSKSDGNIVSPLSIVEGNVADAGKGKGKALGSDVLRVWASSADYTGDVAFSREIVDMAGQRLQRYRVLLKFVLGNIDETTKTIDSFAREDLNLADRFVLDELFRFEQRIRAAYESFDFPKVLMESTNVLNLFSTFYFEMIRDTLYSEAKGAPSRAIIKAVLQSILNIVSQSLGPIVPYFAEELHAHRTDLQNPSVSAFARGWTSPPKAWVDLEAREEMTQLLDMKSLVQGLIDQGRAEKSLTVAQQAHLEIAIDDSPLADIIRKHQSILAHLFNVSHVTVLANPIDEPQSWEYSTTFQSQPNTSGVDSTISLRIFPPSMHKCPRCWIYSSAKEEHLCIRCEGVVRTLEAAAEAS